MKTHRCVRLRATAVEVAVTAVAVTLIALLGPTLDPDPHQPFAELLAQWCAVVLLGCVVWGWLITTLVLVEALRASRVAPLPHRRRGMPAAYRRLVLGACGVALSAGAAAPALATPGPVSVDQHVAGVATAPVTQARVPMQLQPHAQAASAIVVSRGDSLWRLAAERLPPDADNATVAHTWRLLYEANRDVIGSDPDHIEPGQRLTQPRGW
jgi:hypothetical protein